MLFASTRRRFEGMVLRPESVAAAILLVVVGCVVGNIFGSRRGPGLFIVGLSLFFYVGIVTDLIPSLGDEQTLWSFQSLCMGLMAGTLYRLMGSREEQHSAFDEKECV